MLANNDRRPAGATERLGSALSRIHAAELEGKKAFTEVYEQSARREAEASDKRASSGSTLGPLDGRVVSIKALFDVAGTTTTAGSATLRRNKAAEKDAVIVERLRNAGAVIVGKTQMTEFAFSALGTNPHDGQPGNPRDRTRVPGGSSSGAVVSVIDGMAEIAIGSDTGGSLRIPAALSGAVGFKPTNGRVPTSGAFSLSSTLDTIGPIGSSVSDCACADQILSGDLQKALAPASFDGFRLIVARGPLFGDCETAVVDAFNHALERLRGARSTIEEGTLDKALSNIARIDRIGAFTSIELGASLRQLGVTSLDAVDPNTRVRIEAGAGVSGVDYVEMTRLREAAVKSFQDEMSENDVFILPTSPIQAPRFSDIADSAAFHKANGLVLRNPRIANLLDCPSISLPIPSGGLPVGMMLIGRRSADRRLLDIAAAVEGVLANARS